jgi:hypothetical protein
MDAGDHPTGRGDAFVLDARLVGYRVDADGAPIGHVHGLADGAAVVVDLDLVDLGAKRALPVSAVTAVDHDRRVVAVSPTPEQVRSAPPIEPHGASDWLDRLVRHYFGG